ncbi:MAG TPA: YIP1 family protein [Phycisphaerae bacterium]|nr:YIP1 family protein [Phycisphaerae bacterium]HQL54467.1 YIP1 family protein [Phycisphaerae bacterium]
MAPCQGETAATSQRHDVGPGPDEDTGLAEIIETAARRTVGIRDIPLVWVAPRRLFARVEDVPAWRWPLLILLTVVTLIGYATVETGLIDREIDQQVRDSIARIDAMQRDVVERSTLRELYEQEIKQGEFQKLLTRMRVVVAEPAKALSATLLIAATLYGVVALSGRKPEWHTLLTIVVYAGFIDVARLVLQLVLMLHYRTLAVDTSLAPLVQLWPDFLRASPAALGAATGALRALDPFVIWYWLVALVGLHATAQLPGWRAWLMCGLAWLVAAGARAGLAAALVPAGPPGGTPAA